MDKYTQIMLNGPTATKKSFKSNVAAKPPRFSERHFAQKAFEVVKHKLLNKRLKE